MAIQIENIMKSLDITNDQVPGTLLTFLEKRLPIYQDLVLGEHLYSIEDLRQKEEGITADIEAALREIDGLMRANDCAYFRIICP